MWIREMNKADVPAVALLEKECFSDPWPENILTGMFDNGMDRMFVLEDGGAVIGYVNIRILGAEAELMRIALTAEKRGRKLSRLLMDRALLFLRDSGVQAVTLEVRSENLPAVSLYESYGFLREGIRRAYYHDPEDDAVIYWNRKL
jgi:ribosomal-protein-alanine N-acetyltransferase